jgi:phosphoglycerate-specific signal transduction histidine kinase
MPTKQQLTNKIAELEEWLRANSPEHEYRAQIEADLRKAKQDLILVQDGRD